MSPYKKCFFSLCWLLSCQFAFANNIVIKGEYFFDTLGSAGDGKAFTIAEAAVTKFDNYIDASDLTKGSHQLYIRFQDDNNVWSAVWQQNFAVNLPAVNTDAANLIQSVKLTTTDIKNKSLPFSIAPYEVEQVADSGKAWLLIEKYVDLSTHDVGNVLNQLVIEDIYSQSSSPWQQNLTLTEGLLAGDPEVTDYFTQINGGYSSTLVSYLSDSGTWDGSTSIETSELELGINELTLEATNILGNTSSWRTLLAFYDQDNDAIDDRYDSDDDNDGMSDVWELSYGLDPNTANDAEVDSDSDGFTNLQEAVYGTDPNDELSLPDYKVAANSNDFSGDGRADMVLHHGTTGDVWIFTIGNEIVTTRSDTQWKMVGQGDFNGDGYNDLLWQHQTSGDIEIDIIEAVAVNETTTIKSMALDWKVAVTGDINGDGTDDIVLRNVDTGVVQVLQMQLGIIAQQKDIATVNTSWEIATTGDFNGDKRADLWFRHSQSGENQVWLMNGFHVYKNIKLPKVNNEWQLLSAGNFNGDMYSDVLWRNKNTSSTYYYLMDNGGIASQGYLAEKSLTWQFGMIGDFDYDGNEDVIWHDPATGEITMDFMQGASISGSGNFTMLTDNNWMIVPNDYQTIKQVTQFDQTGDNKADVLWRNQVSGSNYLWSMDGMSVSQAKAINSVSLDWAVAGRGDFNGDGKSDILWRNIRSGRNYIWLMDGFNTLESKEVTAITDLQWQVKAVGDFNGDGQADVFWHHQATGRTYVWLMNSFTKTSSKELPKISDTNWQVAASGDFNGDKKMDIYWRHQVTGANYLWLMDGTATKGRYSVGSIGTSWQLASAGDLNGDGTADIIWRHKSDGRNWAHLMSDGQVSTSQLINSIADSNWQIKTMGDFDGDGKADIFWQNQSTGKTYIYLMNGVSIKSRAYSSSISNAWDVIKN